MSESEFIDKFGLEEKIENFIEKYNASESSFFTRALAFKVFYALNEVFNVMVFNLDLLDQSLYERPEDVIYFGHHQFRNIVYGVWVFKGKGQWTNMGDLRHKNWYGLSNRVTRYDLNGNVDPRGRVMKFQRC